MPLLTLLFGIVGYNLRVLEHRNVFDPITGLPERGATTTHMLFALTALFLLVTFLFVLFSILRNKSSKKFGLAFGTDKLYYPFVVTVIGAAWAIGALVYFFELRSYYDALDTIDIIFIISSGVAACSVIIFAYEIFGETERRTPYKLSVIPILFMCFWLVLMYRDNASNPVLLGYVYQILAIAFASLAFYCTACFVYGKSVPGKAIFSYFSAIYFCTITLADGHPVGINIILVAVIAFCFFYASRLIRSMERKH